MSGSATSPSSPASGRPPSAPAQEPAPAAAEPAECGVTDKLVPTCPGHALFGAYVHGYPPNGDRWEQELALAEQRYGRRVAMTHTFQNPGTDLPFATTGAIGPGQRALAETGTILYANLKVAGSWAEGASPTGAAADRIRAAAANVGSLRLPGRTKVMLTIHHEPEDDVVDGSITGCPTRGTIAANTPANYRAMWQNVQRIFAAVLGGAAAVAAKVVWVMNYLNTPSTNCAVHALWPELASGVSIDWISFEAYCHWPAPGPHRWYDVVGRFYTLLSQGADATHQYVAKPWLIAEFGCPAVGNQAAVYQYYRDAKRMLNDPAFQRLRGYQVFDANATWDSPPRDFRTQYQTAGTAATIDPVEQRVFNELSGDPLLNPPTR